MLEFLVVAVALVVLVPVSRAGFIKALDVRPIRPLLSASASRPRFGLR
jgi:hypothetical protein